MEKLTQDTEGTAMSKMEGSSSLSVKETLRAADFGMTPSPLPFKLNPSFFD